MLRGIDHIVVVVRDLAQASADYARAGFTVTPGGEHVGGVTHNALVTFADGTYFELIAFREPDRPRAHRWWPRLAQGEGLVDYALASDDLPGDASRIRAGGLQAVGPSDGGRVRPDGQELAWRSLLLGRGVNQPALPFVIEDVTPRALRVPGGDAARHPLGVTRVAGLTLVVASLASAREAMEKLLGTAGRPGTSSDGATAHFTIGRQWIELLQPADPASAPGQYLQRFGDSPYAVTLSGDRGAGPGEGQPLSGDLHGASIRVAI
jgi:hypothetical protein